MDQKGHKDCLEKGDSPGHICTIVTPEIIEKFLDGRGSDEWADALSRHTEVCRECRGRLEQVVSSKAAQPDCEIIKRMELLTPPQR